VVVDLQVFQDQMTLAVVARLDARPTDESLVAAARAGVEEAKAELFRRHVRAVSDMAHRLLGRCRGWNIGRGPGARPIARHGPRRRRSLRWRTRTSSARIASTRAWVPWLNISRLPRSRHARRRSGAPAVTIDRARALRRWCLALLLAASESQAKSECEAPRSVALGTLDGSAPASGSEP
jgi:hypothetical protein